MAIQFIRHKIDEHRYAVIVPSQASRHVADVQLETDGTWSTRVFPASFWVESGIVTTFANQPTARLALEALAMWGSDEIEIEE